MRLRVLSYGLQISSIEHLKSRKLAWMCTCICFTSLLPVVFASYSRDSNQTRQCGTNPKSYKNWKKKPNLYMCTAVVNVNTPTCVCVYTHVYTFMLVFNIKNVIYLFIYTLRFTCIKKTLTHSLPNSPTTLK